MKIVTSYPSDDYEGSMSLTLQTDTYKGSVSFGAGEPEDMVLARDLNDAYSIEEMLVAAYNAGKAGEDLIVEQGEEE